MKRFSVTAVVRWAGRALYAGILLAPGGVALAQGYPVKPIRLVVPFSPGAGTDSISRILAQEMSRGLGQSITVDNKPGAGGTIGTEIVAKAAADGYTLLFAPASHAINPGLFPHLSYDTRSAFTAISIAASLPVVLAVEAAVPARSVRELIDLAKARPGQLSIASSGNGTVFHLTAELFKDAAGINLIHTPFKGGAPAVTALVGGQVTMAFETSLTLMPQVRAGRLRALAVASEKRVAALPDVPTLAEAGVNGVVSENWYGLHAPAGTPGEIVTRLHAEISKALRTPEVREKLVAQGAEIRDSTPAEAAAFVRSEIAKWGKAIKDSGAKLD